MPVAPTASPTLRVPSDHQSIAAALLAASRAGGGTVVVASGTFHEATTLRLEAGVSLVGSGEDTLIEAEAHTVIACAEGSVRLADLSVRQTGTAAAKAPAFGVEVRGASTLLERCRVSASFVHAKAASVVVHGSAASPTLRECTLHDGGGAGLLLASGARASLSACHLRDCAGVGAVVLASCALTASGGRISGCRDGGLALHPRAAASLSEVELADNGGSGGVPTALVRGGATSLTMRDCAVLDAKGVGVQVGEGGELELSACRLLRSAKAAVAARAPGRLSVESCTLSDGGAAGVMLLQPGGPARLRGNTLSGNAKAAIQVSAGAAPLIEGNTLRDGLGPGVYFLEGGCGSALRNVICGQAGAGIKIENSAPTLERNTVSSGADVGILVAGMARGGEDDGEAAAEAAAAEAAAEAAAAAAAAAADTAAAPTGADTCGPEPPAAPAEPSTGAAKPSENPTYGLGKYVPTKNRKLSNEQKPAWHAPLHFKGIDVQPERAQPSVRLEMEAEAEEEAAMAAAGLGGASGSAKRLPNTHADQPAAAAAAAAAAAVEVAAARQATVRGNEIFGNAGAGLQIGGGACPLVVRRRPLQLSRSASFIRRVSFGEFHSASFIR